MIWGIIVAMACAVLIISVIMGHKDEIRDNAAEGMVMAILIIGLMGALVFIIVVTWPGG